MIYAVDENLQNLLTKYACAYKKAPVNDSEVLETEELNQASKELAGYLFLHYMVYPNLNLEDLTNLSTAKEKMKEADEALNKIFK